MTKWIYCKVVCDDGNKTYEVTDITTLITKTYPYNDLKNYLKVIDVLGLLGWEMIQIDDSVLRPVAWFKRQDEY